MEYTQKPYTCRVDNSISCLSFFMHSNQLFQTITQSFYIAISLISIRETQSDGSTRNKLSAGVGNIRGRNNCLGVRKCPKKSNFRKKSHSAESCRTVPKIPYLYTLSQTLSIEPNYTLC